MEIFVIANVVSSYRIIIQKILYGRSISVVGKCFFFFGNNNGLVSEGGNLFTRGPSSGAAEIGTALSGKRGSLLSKNLESSNVELTSEFTNLIATQRAYQANARTITTSDAILQELVSLVR